MSKVKLKWKRIAVVCLMVCLITTLAGCKEKKANSTTLYLFAANSMSDAMDQIIKEFEELNPSIEVLPIYESVGILLTQVEEGARCDIFLSASDKQIKQLQEKQLVIENSIGTIVENQLIVITYKGSNTKVKGLATISDATSISIANGTVPAGNYTRKALIKLGILEEVEDSSKISTQEISNALENTTINEAENVGAVTLSVAEHSNEIGTCYNSDFVKFTKQGFELEIVEKVSKDLTGPIVYPVCLVKNEKTSKLEQDAASDFRDFLFSKEAMEMYEEYGFETK